MAKTKQVEYHEYIIDLCSFGVVARNEDEAYEKAQEQIKEGDIQVDQVIDEGEYDNEYNEEF